MRYELKPNNDVSMTAEVDGSEYPCLRCFSSERSIVNIFLRYGEIIYRQCLLCEVWYGTFKTSEFKFKLLFLIIWEHPVAQLVDALHYKPEDRGFDFPMGSMEFVIGAILLAALWSWG